MTQTAILKQRNANEEIIQILLGKDELTWRNIIYELVNTEQMDPWDIDVSKLAVRFLDMVQTLQKMDFRITGKLVLAAALLLKIKSNQLLEEDLTALDSLIEGAEEPIDLLEELPMPFVEEEKEEETPTLTPKTPQPRKRKVAVADLVDALEKALKVEMRRVKAEPEEEIEVNLDDVDISKVIMEVYEQVQEHYATKEEKLTFTHLVPEGASKNDKVFTFIPLLHLDHQGNVDISQEQSFGEIFIEFLKELEGDFVVASDGLGA